MPGGPTHPAEMAEGPKAFPAPQSNMLNLPDLLMVTSWPVEDALQLESDSWRQAASPPSLSRLSYYCIAGVVDTIGFALDKVYKGLY